jgi:hypothetical protein
MPPTTLAVACTLWQRPLRPTKPSSFSSLGYLLLLIICSFMPPIGVGNDIGFGMHMYTAATVTETIAPSPDDDIEPVTD